MTTTTQSPLPPTSRGHADDSGRAASGTIYHVWPPSTPAMTAGDTSSRPVVRHVVDAATQAALQPVSTLSRARSPSFTSPTDMRMLATMGWLPVWLAVSTVVALYLLPDMKQEVVYVLIGAAAGLLAWVGWSAATQGDALADRANSRSYGDLVARMADAEADIERRVAAGRLAADAPCVAQFGALKARVYASPPQADWASGIAYVNAWRDLHRVEEALIDIAEPGELDGILRHDEQRVDGSKLSQEGGFVRKLLDDARPKVGRQDLAVRPQLRAIRAAVNEFRDSRFETLVRNRIHVDRVSLLLGLTAWGLVCLAILGRVGAAAVTWASVLYLVGAATGLLTQLRSGISETLEDVFGYGQASLRQTVLMSGLAGVGGVFLTLLASAATNDITHLAVADALPFTAFSVVTAAFFGFAPGTLTDRLNTWAKTNLKELESTTAG